MFENCNTLAELNAERIKIVNDSTDLISVNNAYNRRRQEILNVKQSFVKLEPIIVKPREVNQFCGIPIAGRSEEKGCIKFTKKGFLY